MNEVLAQAVLLFFIYSFLGWCAEVAFQACAFGKIVNRGFLNGPICPIYGVGMLGVLLILEPFHDNLILLFSAGMLFATLIELVGGFILDKAFQMRWWDYSKEPLNFKGYICVRFSVVWGLAIVGVIKIIHTPIMSLVEKIPLNALLIVTAALSIYFIVDLCATVQAICGLQSKFRKLENIASSMHNMSDDLTDIVSAPALKAGEDFKEIKEKTDKVLQEKQREIDDIIVKNKDEFNKFKSEKIEKINKKYEDLAIAKEENLRKNLELENKFNDIYNDMKKSFGVRRMLKAYPRLHSSNKPYSIQDELKLLRIKIKSYYNGKDDSSE